MDTFLLLSTIVCLIFALFFSTLELAYRAANKLQMQVEGELGKLPAKMLALFANRPSWFIGTTLAGNILSLVGTVTSATLLLTPMLVTNLPAPVNHISVVLLLLVLITGTLVIIGVVVLPRRLSVLNPNGVLKALVWPFGICFIALFVLTIPIIAMTKFVMTRILKMKYEDEKPFIGLPDLHQFLRNHKKVKAEEEDFAMNKKILTNALEFKTVKIRECMVPRTEITAAEINDSIEKLRSVFVESGHSKVIIYKQSLDEIVGYCHSSSLFKLPKSIQDILTPIIIVAETTLANELMIRFINERKSLAVVVDEFGGTSGIVSMEDVIEEIFGEIEDEHDEEDQLLVEQKLYENSYLISARLEVDYLNETYGWNLPTGEYETLGGLILAYAEDFPKQGQTILVPPFTFIIQTTGQNRIKTVIVDVEKEGKSPS